MCDLFGTLGGAVNMVSTPDDDTSDDDDMPLLVGEPSDGESSDDDEELDGARTPIDKRPLAGAATVTPDARPERPPCLEGFRVLALDDDLRRPPP